MQLCDYIRYSCVRMEKLYSIWLSSPAHTPTLKSNWNCFCGAASLPKEDVLSMYNGNWTSAQKLNKNNYNMVFSHLTFPFARLYWSVFPITSTQGLCFICKSRASRIQLNNKQMKSENNLLTLSIFNFLIFR